jgi:hypothetical protein
MTSRALSLARRAYLEASFAAIFLALAAVALPLFVYMQEGRGQYVWLLREDGPAETMTAILLGLASLAALVAIFKVPATLRWARGFLVLFAIFSALMALEEISWGQRMFNIESAAFFQHYSDQNETSFHNVVQQYLKQHGFAVTTTRQIAAIVLLAYGVVLPILNVFTPFRSWFRACRVVVPPPALVPGFLLGAILSWLDRPTGREEELGELLFALSFAFLVPLWRLEQNYLAESAEAG